MGKLGWLMLKTEVATSPPREGEPAGTWIMATLDEGPKGTFDWLLSQFDLFSK